ncbi:MAG: hypothetical protein KDK27_01960 [Leptospiraceae bacterium]|nr:hypothetical protein [Leptospiraceae bacterium]
MRSVSIKLALLIMGIVSLGLLIAERTDFAIFAEPDRNLAIVLDIETPCREKPRITAPVIRNLPFGYPLDYASTDVVFDFSSDDYRGEWISTGDCFIRADYLMRSQATAPLELLTPEIVQCCLEPSDVELMPLPILIAGDYFVAPQAHSCMGCSPKTFVVRWMNLGTVTRSNDGLQFQLVHHAVCKPDDPEDCIITYTDPDSIDLPELLSAANRFQNSSDKTYVLKYQSNLLPIHQAKEICRDRALTDEDISCANVEQVEQIYYHSRPVTIREAQDLYPFVDKQNNN